MRTELLTPIYDGLAKEYGWELGKMGTRPLHRTTIPRLRSVVGSTQSLGTTQKIEPRVQPAVEADAPIWKQLEEEFLKTSATGIPVVRIEEKPDEQPKGKYLDIQDFYTKEVETAETSLMGLLYASMASRYVTDGLTDGNSNTMINYAWIHMGMNGLDPIETIGTTPDNQWDLNMYNLGKFLAGDFPMSERMLKCSVKNTSDLKGILAEQETFGPVTVVAINKVQVPHKNFSALFSLQGGEVQMKIRTGVNQGKTVTLNASDLITYLDEESGIPITLHKELFELLGN